MKQKILAVDDNETNLKILEEILESDYELRTCTSGEEALEVVPEFLPEIVLLDIMMPGIDGYEVCRRIRQEKKLAHTKVIMVSAKALVDERLKGYEVGADDYVTKPFNDDELLSKVRVFLRLKSVEEIDEFKTEVLSLLSDQLHTPLRSLALPAEILQSEDVIDHERRKRYARVITRNAGRLQAFFDKALALTRMRSGKWKPRREELCLSQLTHSSIADLEEDMAERGVRVDENADASVRALVDREQFGMVLNILIENAVRFSPSGGEVTVSVRKEGGRGCVTVTDRGAGISPEAIPGIFEGIANITGDHVMASEDVDWQVTHDVGLALAHEIVRQHGGELSVSSTLRSETTFTIRVPLTPVDGDGTAEETGSLAAVGSHGP